MHNIMIGTPAYGGMVHIDFVNSILPLQNTGVNFSVVFIGNQSLITRARNDIFSLFVSDKGESFSHLLFLDADMGVRPEHIKQLLEHDKPLIAMGVPLKGFREDGGLFFNVGEVLEQEDNNLVSVDKVGTAVMAIRRDLALELKEWAIQNDRVYYKKKNKQLNNVRQDSEGEQYNVFDVGVYDGEYLSEDFYFCRVVKQLGHKVYVDSSIPTRHNANYVFAS